MTSKRIAMFGAALLSVCAVPSFAAPCAGTPPFQDIAQADFFCTDTEWMRNRGVTLGCTTTLYCPTDFVSRAAMAAFMNRLGLALTPVVQTTDAQLGAGDIDVTPVVCELPAIAPANYPRQALMNGTVALQFNGDGAAQVRLKYNTDGTSVYPTFVAGNNGRAASPAPGWGSGTSVGLLNLDAGTTYRFAIDLARSTGNGTGDYVAGRCQVFLLIMNRNGTSSPFDSGSGSDENH